MSISAMGVGSGIDFQSLIDGLVKIESQQQVTLQNKVASRKSLVSAYQALNTQFSNLRTSAADLALPTFWKSMAATSSSTNVSATVTNAATAGAFSFSVKQLATAEVKASSGTVSSPDTVIASGSLLLGSGGAIGIGGVSGSGLSAGAHTIEVTQASSGASTSGSVLGSSITLDGSESLVATIDGTPRTISLAAGTYSRQGLADAISSASGGLLRGSVNNDGSLRLSTQHEGSAATLSVDGGTGLFKLGLSPGSPVTAGTDAVVKVGSVSTTISSIDPNSTSPVTLAGDAGSIDVTFSGGLRAGSATFQNLDLGDGKISTVAAAITRANAGVSAAVVQVGTGQYKLQLQATETGAAGRMSTDFSALSGVLGEFQTVTSAQDAVLQVGTGAGAYQITSSSNSLKDVMPGVTLNLRPGSLNENVTVNVGASASEVSTKVKGLVDNVNTILKSIRTNSSYDAENRQGGIFLGNYTAQMLQRNVSNAMTALNPNSGGLANVGITIERDGTYAFDEAKFKAAYEANPDSVARLFVDGGTTGQLSGIQGIAQSLRDVATNATSSVSGIITAAIKGENNIIDDLNKQVTRWSERIDTYRNRLKSQFAAVDALIASMQSQQGWLAGQINSLPKFN